jgi:hypothetical protein
LVGRVRTWPARGLQYFLRRLAAASAHLKGVGGKFQQVPDFPSPVRRQEGAPIARSRTTSAILFAPMNPLISLLIRLLTAAFVVGCTGCAILIPVVAFKFVAVLFEPDPPAEPASSQD